MYGGRNVKMHFTTVDNVTSIPLDNRKKIISINFPGEAGSVFPRGHKQWSSSCPIEDLNSWFGSLFQPFIILLVKREKSQKQLSSQPAKSYNF